jgi:hypothetical protein
MRAAAMNMINPFENVIVSEPRRIEKPVRGLNDKPLQELFKKFKLLTDGDHPRAKKLQNAQFIRSPSAGFGKSHLIGRLFNDLKATATLVYLRPFSDTTTCWQSILLKTIQEMEFPESAATEFCSEDEPSQLETFAHGTIINIFINAMRNNAIKVEKRDSIIKYLDNLTLQQMKIKKTWIKGVAQKKQKLAQLMQSQFKKVGLNLNASSISWLSVLIQCAYFPNDFALRESCLDWLKGGSIDSEDAERIGIRPKDRLGGDATMSDVNDTCKRRIFDICCLAGYYRPFMFCFDQTENYGNDRELARTLGLVVQELVDYSYNSMIIITANQQPWNESLEPHWEEAHKARLAYPFLELEGLNRTQGLELIQNRLKTWNLGKKEIAAFVKDKWLDELFPTPQIGVRQFLNECSKRWQKLKDHPPVPHKIEEYFNEFIHKIKSQPRRLVFDPDILYWIVNDLVHLPEGRIEKFKSPKGYLSLRWKINDRHIYFGFEPGSNWSRWRAITREAKRIFESDKKSNTVFFRTQEHKPIPGQWKIAPEINVARNKFLHILELDQDTIAWLYAAYDLYVASVEGDIPFESHEVLAFLRETLNGFLERILESDATKWRNTKAEEEKPKSINETNEDLIKMIREIVRREKFLSVEELISKIKPPVTEEEIHRARACIAEIKVHTSPTMTVLQWQSNI